MDRNILPAERWWTVQHGPGPVVATAIHDGHELRPEIAAQMALGDGDRLREEDPFTGDAVRGVASHVIAHRSRFEFDLNRDAANAVYRTPEQSWGLEVWTSGALEPALAERSLELHALYYRMLGGLLDDLAARHERFAVLDVHSYNHRRAGPEAAPTPPEEAPDINIGTFSMPREQWAFLVDPLMDAMREDPDVLMVGELLRLQRSPARRSRKRRLPGQGRTDALHPSALSGPRLRDRARIQEVLHGRVERPARPGGGSGDARLHRVRRDDG